MSTDRDRAKKISATQVKYVASLARLELSPDEVDRFTTQLNSILEYMDQLNELDTSEVEPTSHVFPLKNVLREDEIGHSLTLDEVLANAPEHDKDHFVVPKIIE
jgi:aspartyl-tRNA(Asn)/glutamyl-tRNA(Gln) amidotransferase subunit C